MAQGLPTVGKDETSLGANHGEHSAAERTRKRAATHGKAARQTPFVNGVTKRLQFQFPEAAIHTLRDLAVRTGQPTIAGVLREALKV